MIVSSATNSPSMKAGLFYTDAQPIFNQSLGFEKPPKGLKTSPAGVRYIEAQSIPENIKKRIENVPLIKYLAEKYETFVLYKEGLFPGIRPGNHRASILLDVDYANRSKKRAEKCSFSSLNYKGDLEFAREDVFYKLHNSKANRKLTGNLTLGETIVEGIKKLLS